jgi:hypothetical protein
MKKTIYSDTREQKNAEVLRYFQLVGQPYEVVKVESGDYIYKNDYSVIIDLKKNLVEVCGNIAGTKKQHERFKREIARARELGCNRFVVLIREPLANIEEVQTWESPKLRNGRKLVSKPPTALYKTMKTFETKYGVEWKFTTRIKAGKDIIDILNGVK